ncbi:MAG: SLC13 family permease, partial [Candidatus Latescibacteria bacterium]|nr:SLC13 family permease [Candidatus Latescibacterota bacterium]
ILGLILGLTLPLTFLLLPGELATSARLALALTVLTVIFWTFEPVPIPYTAILVLVLFPLLEIIPFATAFSGFAGKAVWLVFAGMALSLGITETPLGARMAHLVLDRIGSYNQLILGLHVLGLTMALLIPSGVVRVLITMPMVVSLLKSLNETPGSKVSAGLVLSLTCATYYSGTGILTAGVPNLVILGVLESRNITIYWSEWAFYLFPVIGLLRVGLIYGLIRLLFRPEHEPDLSTHPNIAKVPEHLTPPEKKVLIILIVGILFWVTDVLHGVHPVYIGLALVLLCYLPGWGPLPFDTIKKVNFPLLIFISAVFAIGHALENSGLNSNLTIPLAHYLETAKTPTAQLSLIAWSAVPFDFLMDTAAVGGVLAPLLLDLSTQLGLSPLPVALSLAIGTGVVFIPYQGAPFIVAYSFRYARMGQFVLVMSLISLLTLILLLPLTLLYWRIIGFI